VALTPGTRLVQYEVTDKIGLTVASCDRGIDWKAANNTGTAERLAEPASEGAGNPTPYFFTPDGAALVFRDQDVRDTRDGVAMIPVGGATARRSGD